MIYTLTVNPSLDYIMDIPNFETGIVNRTSDTRIVAGGKGINVSVVLSNLGIDNTALGFTAGFTGNEIERQLVEKNIACDFIHMKKGISRINVKLRAIEETEINAAGPEINSSDLELLFYRLECLCRDDILVLAGSLPQCLGPEFYCEVMKRLTERKVSFIVDAEKDLLVKSCIYKPFLIKPNHLELGEIFGVKLKNRSEVVPYAKTLQDKGARNVLVSLAGEGAVLVAEDGNVYECEAPHINVVNSVGAGDSMVAGFIAGWIENGSYMNALKYGTACGSATASMEGLVTQESFDSLKSQVIVNLIV